MRKSLFCFPLRTFCHGDETKAFTPHVVEDNRGIQNFPKVAEEHRQVVLPESEGDVADVESLRTQEGGDLITGTSLDLDISSKILK